MPAADPAAYTRHEPPPHAVASDRRNLALPQVPTAIGSPPPAELEKRLASEIDRWGAVIRAAKIEPL